MFFLKTMAKQKNNLAEKVKEEQALAHLCPRFPARSGTGENARRDHRQGNRRIHRRQPQHHQGACEETGRTAISAAARPRARRASHDQVGSLGIWRGVSRPSPPTRRLHRGCIVSRGLIVFRRITSKTRRFTDTMSVSTNPLVLQVDLFIDASFSSYRTCRQPQPVHG